MLKTAFLEALQSGLAGLPQQDIEERLAFYGEMIDDRMEEGLSEEEAVDAIGPVDRVINEIVAQTPLTKMQRCFSMSSGQETGSPAEYSLWVFPSSVSVCSSNSSMFR